MIQALDPDPESDFQTFVDSGSGLGSSKSGIITPRVFNLAAAHTEGNLTTCPD